MEVGLGGEEREAFKGQLFLGAFFAPRNRTGIQPIYPWSTLFRPLRLSVEDREGIRATDLGGRWLSNLPDQPADGSIQELDRFAVKGEAIRLHLFLHCFFLSWSGDSRSVLRGQEA